MIDLYLSTLGEGAGALARKYGLGLEISDFSYAVNMDTDFSRWDALTQENLAGIHKRVFHAPYNELCPAAIDPLIREVTRKRLEQAFQLTRRYEITRMIVHSGYMPRFYFKDWFADQSAAFWRDFLRDKPADFTLLLENVAEESPDMLLDIIEKTADGRFRLCLDLGHAGGAFSQTPVLRWAQMSAPYLSHVHIHNNYYTEDLHNPPGDGLIDIEAAIDRIAGLQPFATYTAETADLPSALSWFEEHGFI